MPCRRKATGFCVERQGKGVHNPRVGRKGRNRGAVVPAYCAWKGKAAKLTVEAIGVYRALRGRFPFDLCRGF